MTYKRTSYCQIIDTKGRGYYIDFFFYYTSQKKSKIIYGILYIYSFILSHSCLSIPCLVLFLFRITVVVSSALSDNNFVGGSHRELISARVSEEDQEGGEPSRLDGMCSAKIMASFSSVFFFYKFLGLLFNDYHISISMNGAPRQYVSIEALYLITNLNVQFKLNVLRLMPCFIFSS